MFDELDEAVANLDRDFTRLELSVIIEALIAYRGMGMRPDFDAVDIESIQDIDDVAELEIPARPFNEEEDETIGEMMLLFMAGFGRLIQEQEEIVNESGKELVKEIAQFLKDNK